MKKTEKQIREQLALALQRCLVELEYCHVAMAKDRRETRNVFIQEGNRALREFHKFEREGE